MKAIKSILKKQSIIVWFLQVEENKMTDKLILNPIYECDDETQLFI